MKIKHETATEIILTHKEKDEEIEFHVPKPELPYFILADGSRKIVEYGSPYGKLIRRELSK